MAKYQEKNKPCHIALLHLEEAYIHGTTLKVNKIRVLSNTYSYAVSDLEQFKQLLKISDDSFGCELPSKWKRALRFRTTDLKLFNQEVAQKPLHLSKLFRKVLNQEKKHKL
ncbi:hypothetical protein Y032_0301g1843 [Ancylostoma ceylanicum]|uniref:Uncharacterized protein n=1 Tax=Ancylostoma ceylanicum TaxID=53326 RepID=A0A016S3R6_9BILA|nr:hypothetical protein Y032_0301g1843 [Ancylostoma ceylanicum]